MWRKGSDGRNSIAEQIATEEHWSEIRAIILVVSDAKKDTSSTKGMTADCKAELSSLLLLQKQNCRISWQWFALMRLFL